MSAIGIIGIIVSLGLLMFLAYKGWSVILMAPLLALLALCFQILSGGGGNAGDLIATYTERFMVSLATYVRNNFPMFMLGAVFGKVMEASGSAKAIALAVTRKVGRGKELLAIVLSCGILTYGGVSLFVVVFAIYPIGAVMFREADIPKRMLPPCIALGAFTFTMTAIPGTPQIQNAIPMPYFGTDAYAAPILGIVAAIFMFVLGSLWLSLRLKKMKAAGEGYGDYQNENLMTIEDDNLPSMVNALSPILVVLLVNLIFSKVIFPEVFPDPTNAETFLSAYPSEALPSAVIGKWSLIIGLIIGILMTVCMNLKRIKDKTTTLKEGVQGSFLAIMNTASETGYGNCIAALAAFSIISAAMTGISTNPLVGDAISSTTLAGITGSASGGMSIALEAFGTKFLEMADAVGISPEALHRVASIASGGMDTLPHNGAVITLLTVTGLTHKESYPNIGMVTVVIPLFSLIFVVILGSLGVN